MQVKHNLITAMTFEFGKNLLQSYQANLFNWLCLLCVSGLNYYRMYFLRTNTYFVCILPFLIIVYFLISAKGKRVQPPWSPPAGTDVPHLRLYNSLTRAKVCWGGGGKYQKGLSLCYLWKDICVMEIYKVKPSVYKRKNKDPYRVIRSMYCMYDKKLPCILFESIKNTHITASCVFEKMNLLVCCLRLIVYSVCLLSFYNVWCLCCKKYSWNTLNEND